MGEAKRRQLQAHSQALEAMVVDTPGGRIHVQWDCTASCHTESTVEFFCRVFAGHGRLRVLAQSLPLDLQQPQRPR